MGFDTDSSAQVLVTQRYCAYRALFREQWHAKSDSRAEVLRLMRTNHIVMEIDRHRMVAYQEAQNCLRQYVAVVLRRMKMPDINIWRLRILGEPSPREPIPWKPAGQGVPRLSWIPKIQWYDVMTIEPSRIMIRT